MRDLADGFAAQDYTAMCPDLFWRQEPGVQITDKSEAEWKKAFQLMQGFNTDKGIDDLKATLATLRKHQACTGKVGSIGYCLGGKLAFLMATRSDSDANVSYYGVGLQDLLGEAKNIKKPLLLQSGLGTEAAGIVEEVGPGVTDVKPGDRVAYVGGPLGAYSETRVMPVERLVVLPKGISEQQGAAMMLKGLTTQYLIRQIFKVKKGDTILFHAAAGGGGLIACQWAKSLGATVIGTVGSEEKAKLAKEHGCDSPILYTREDFVARVKDITKGEMVPLVYDSVGN